MNLTHDDVREIVGLLDASHFDELKIETARFKLTLKRAGDGGWTQESASAAPAASDAAAKSGRTEVALAPGTAAIRAPMVGTFYRAPKPGAEPFVEVGSKVGPDTVVAILEAMKLMNAVPAGTRGTVTEILIQNGELADQDRILMIVALDGA
jgi:acetyl-CoA carboxylase biotin carboxyl carrier protein